MNAYKAQEVQRGFLAAVAFVTTTALGLYMYTSRAAGLKIPVAALFSVLTKKSADDVEDKAIRMRQVNEDAKARARRLEDAINNLKKTNRAFKEFIANFLYAYVPSKHLRK